MLLEYSLLKKITWMKKFIEKLEKEGNKKKDKKSKENKNQDL